MMTTTRRWPSKEFGRTLSEQREDTTEAQGGEQHFATDLRGCGLTTYVSGARRDEDLHAARDVDMYGSAADHAGPSGAAELSRNQDFLPKLGE